MDTLADRTVGDLIAKAALERASHLSIAIIEEEDCSRYAASDPERRKTKKESPSRVTQKSMDLTPKTATELGLDPELVDEAGDILAPYDKLVPVQVLDEWCWLPENNSIWRGLQFWGIVKGKVTIDFGLFCISGTCKHCKALVQETQMDDRESMLLCQTIAKPGTHIKKLPQGFRLKKW